MRRSATAVVLLLSGVLLLMQLGHRTFAQSELPRQTLWGIYWTVEPGFTSTLEMKNNHRTRALTVQVSLYFASGGEFELAPLIVQPRQTVLVELNRIVASLPSSIAARASQEGTLELSFDAETPSMLMGSVSVTNPEQGIAWNFFLYPWRAGVPLAPLRGVFWFQNTATDGFVAMQNVSEEFLTVIPKFQLAGQTYALPTVRLAPEQGYKLSLRNELRALGLQDARAGGIDLAFDGVPDALKAHGVLFDKKGFSAEIDFTRYESWDEQQTVRLRTPRFAVGPADPNLGLPAPTMFEPIVALHNFNGHSLDVTLQVGYRVGEENREERIPVSLSPGNTQVLSLRPLLGGVLPTDISWASLELSYTDRHTGLAAAMVSVSQDGSHSVRSVLNWVTGNIREGWYWQVDADHTTVLGIFNSDTEEAQLAVSLDYSVAGVTRSYELPLVTIGPRSARNIDIGQVISRGVPDADGDVIPSSVSFGGYRVQKLNRIQANITTEALVIDRRKKSYLTFYNTACCVSFPRFTPTAINGVVGDTFQINITGSDTCTADPVDLTGQGQHVSGNTNVATVGFSSGIGSLVGAGATYINSSVVYLRAHIEQCFESSRSDTCSVTSKPKIESISPSRGLIGSTTAVTIAGKGFGTSPTVQAGSGIIVNVTSASNTQIQANFVVAANATAGDHGVTVTAAGQTSNSVNFFVQIPTTFSALSVVQSGQVCDLGTSGYLADVRYQATDQAGNPISRAGMTPQEHVTVNGQDTFPEFRPLATPPTTDSSGIFNDIPVGTCFGPPFPLGNPCVDVVQTFNLTVGQMTFAINTVTTRRDCAVGIRVQVSPGSTTTLGTVN